MAWESDRFRDFSIPRSVNRSQQPGSGIARKTSYFNRLQGTVGWHGILLK